jgi:predicted Rdx family selenoprotein
MARTEITVRVIRRGPRAHELLAAVARHLGKDALEPDDLHAVRIPLSERGPVAWERVRDALDAAGSDWREWLHLEARPRR